MNYSVMNTHKSVLMWPADRAGSGYGRERCCMRVFMSVSVVDRTAERILKAK